ncbi:hypothetical protein PCE1_001527 [Barthelona sp. PCE]
MSSCATCGPEEGSSCGTGTSATAPFLIEACLMAKMEFVDVLLAEGANVCEYCGGTTPLLAAIQGGSLDIVRKLIGIDEKCIFTTPNPLVVAKMYNKSDAIFLYLQSMPNIRAMTQEERFYVDLVCGNFDNVVKGMEIIDPKECIYINENPMTVLAKVFDATKHIDILDFLVQNGFDINTCDETTPSLLFSLIEKAPIELLRRLCEMGADVNIDSSFNRSLLFSAALAYRVDVVDLLIEFGADVDFKDSLDTDFETIISMVWEEEDVAKYIKCE